MDYMGWILSIYDKCEKQYKEKHNKNERRTKKEIWNALWKKENRYMSALLILFIVGLIATGILYFWGALNNAQYYILILMAGFCIGTIPILYKYELSLEEYEEKLNILKDILDERNLNNKETIKFLLKKTKGSLYKIISIAISLFSSLVSAGLLKYGIDFIKEKLQTVIPVVFVILIIVVPIFLLCYQIALIIPNSRIERRQKFHQLLKILYVYTFKEDMGVKKGNILENIDMKELANGIKEYLEK